MSLLLEADHLAMSIRGIPLLKDVNLEVRSGETLAIVGPNGAGKSTLLRLLSADLQPSRGQIRLKQRLLAAYKPAELAMHRAVLSQHIHVTFPFTVEEVVSMGAGDANRLAATPLVESALADVGMTAFRHRQFPTLSGGEQQRIHFARVLVQLARAEARHGPGLLLLDEPTSSLDLKHQVTLVEIARRRARDGTAVIAVLHDLNLAVRFADRMLMLRKGAIAAEGSPRHILTRPLMRDIFEIDVDIKSEADGSPVILPQLVRPIDGIVADDQSRG